MLNKAQRLLTRAGHCAGAAAPAVQTAGGSGLIWSFCLVFSDKQRQHHLAPTCSAIVVPTPPAARHGFSTGS